MIVIAAIIVTGMFIILIAISCALREKGAVSTTQEVKSMTSTLGSRQTTEWQLPTVEEDMTSYSITVARTPVDMQTRPPPQRDPSDHSEYAESTELDYYFYQGKTLQDVTQEFKL